MNSTESRTITLGTVGSHPIVETFHSVQGEGFWTGTNAFFIRLAGCDVGCPWCDTKISWSPKRHPEVAISDFVVSLILSTLVCTVYGRLRS